MKLGYRIKTRRVLCWLTQDEFARRVGVSRRQVAYWETDKDAPSAESIRRICLVLQVSADWLLTGKGWLRETFDSRHYQSRKNAHFAAVRDIHTRTYKIPIFDSLSLTPRAKSPALPVLEDDQEAIALAIHSDEHQPVYCEGDILLMKPLNIQISEAALQKHDTKILASLNQKHAVVSLNGENSIKLLEMEPRPDRQVKTHLHPVVRTAKAHKVLTLRPTDDLKIQAVIYRCVRNC